MRFLPCLALSVAVLGCSPSCSKESVDPYAAMPPAPLEVEPASLDLGSVTYGERTSGTYRLQNISSEPLTISRIGPFSCQCVYADLTLPDRSGDGARRKLDGKRLQLTLEPGERMEILFALDTSRFRKPASRKVGSIPIVFPDHPGMILEWGADIWTPFAVEPWSVDLQEVGVRQRATGTAMVVAHDNSDFRLDVDTVFEDGWSAKSRRTLVEGGLVAYELTFTAPEALPEGPFQREFKLYTDLQDAPPVRVTVQGFAREDMSMSPTRLVFDPTREVFEAQLILHNRAAGGTLEGLDLSAFESGPVVIASRVELDAQRLALQLRYEGEATREGNSFKIPIPTGDPSTPVLEVPITVMPLRGDS